MSAAVQRYSKGAILLHWLIALLLAGTLALGFAMPQHPSAFPLYQFHKSLGITILLLTLVRIGWRLTHARPARLEGGFNGFLASAVHVGFYAFLLAMPLSGWFMVSTAPPQVPTILFGTIPWPHLPLPDSLFEPMEETHEILAWVGVALFVAHVAGALRHHLLMNDGLLARMSPGGRSPVALALFGAVLLVGIAVFFSIDRNPEGAGERPQAEQPATGQSPQADGTTPEPSPSAEAEDDATREIEVEAEEADTRETEPEPSETTDAQVEEAAPEPVRTDAPVPDWTIRPGGSLRFAVDNDGSTLNGSFSQWDGTIAMDTERPGTAEIAITVDLASASLGDATQDEMLSGASFFDTSSFPQATWRSTEVRRVEGNRYEADGTLTLKGASRPQSLTFTLEGEGAGRSVSGTARVDREAFSVGTGSNAAGLGPTVRLSFAFDAVR